MFVQQIFSFEKVNSWILRHLYSFYVKMLDFCDKFSRSFEKISQENSSIRLPHTETLALMIDLYAVDSRNLTDY